MTAQAIDAPSRVWRLGIALRAGWGAYARWRAERRAIAHLRTISDRQLRDIGIVRSQIELAVRYGTERPPVVDRRF